MARAHRVDQTQSTIVAALRAAGCLVLDLSAVGHGCPDLAVLWRDRETGEPRVVLAEVKNPATRGRLTPEQRTLLTAWSGAVVCWWSVDEALATVGIRSNGQS